MRTSFFVAFVFAATQISAAPVNGPSFNFPVFTVGGGAQSGNTGSTDGGSILNSANKVINLAGANHAAQGGSTVSGSASGGSGTFGGGALSGNTGSSLGGDVVNEANFLVNGNGANSAGSGGYAASGAAYGGTGHTKRNVNIPSFNMPQFTVGGGAQSGNTGAVDGGSVYNSANVVKNLAGANHAAQGGSTVSGSASGGSGTFGGGALSGNSGTALGGNVVNEADFLVNGNGANTAGSGGYSASGAAYGGTGHTKRNMPSFNVPQITFGGGAQSGNTGAVDGGSILNSANGVINKAGANQAAHGGSTQTGYAQGGSGTVGGGALSGNSGTALGGSVVNEADFLLNGNGANSAGSGGYSSSGNAVGGNGVH